MMLGIPCGGWCPKGRRAEDGQIPGCYPLTECRSRDYARRTALNVEQSDGTLIITSGELTGGTALTHSVAARRGRPVLVVDPQDQADSNRVEAWVEKHRIRILNIAGPRQSQQPGIYESATEFLKAVLSHASQGHAGSQE